MWAASTPVPHSPSGDQAGWIVGWDVHHGLSDLAHYQADFDEISIFAYELDANNHLVLEDDTASLNTQVPSALRPGARLFVTVVNDVQGRAGKQPAVIRDLVRDSKKMQAHIRELVAIAAPYNGLEIDYEALKKLPQDEKLTQNFNRFIQDLAVALHSQGKWLAIDIEPEPLNMDWRAIGQAVDEFKVMAYYDHCWGTDPGALMTPKTLQRIIEYARSQDVPAEKLMIALPTYGFDWTLTGSGTWKAEQLEHADPAALAGTGGTTLSQISRDENVQPHFSYSDSKGSKHDVWYADDESLARQKLTVIAIGERLHYPVKNFAYWRLGRGNINFHTLKITDPQPSRSSS